MTRITPEDARKAFGISADHEHMVNGERRFRLVDKNGLGYVRTEAGEVGAWQNSHFHRTMHETYIVQTGWIAVATIADINSAPVLIMLEPEQTWTSPINVAHNVYMPAGAVTHVVKHGPGDASDWQVSDSTKELDRITHALSEYELLDLAERSD